MAKKKYYAVKVGRKPGVYTTWKRCKEQIFQYSGAVYKSFTNRKDAEKFVNMGVYVGKGDTKKYKRKDAEAILLSKKENAVSIYTDGSWAKTTNGGKMYAGGFLVIEKGRIVSRQTVNGDDPGLAELRNVAGEMQAVVRAINYVYKGLPHVKNLHVFVDYTGLIHWATPKGAGGWKRNNLYTNQYGDYLEKMKKELNIQLIHVKGHNKDPFNEEADRLAEYSKQLYLDNRKYNEVEFWKKYSYLEKLTN